MRSLSSSSLRSAKAKCIASITVCSSSAPENPSVLSISDISGILKLHIEQRRPNLNLPLMSVMSYKFAKPGLYPRERKWLISVLILTTAMVPISIFIIWAFGLPALFDLSMTHGVPEGVLVRYDAASIFSLGLGASWVLVVWSVTTTTLSLSRIFGMVHSGKTRFRNRMLAISTGIVILTLPVEYDGLKIVIAILTALSAEMVSQTAPVKMELWDPHANTESTT